MTLIKILLKEMEDEAIVTRKMLTRVPEDKYDWKPHPKSMSVKALATHLAELPSWVTLAITTDGLDFAAEPYKPYPINNTAELLAYFEKNYEEGRTQLLKAKDEDLLPSWIMRNGEQILMTFTKGETVRHAFSQTIHHRAQLGVFLRLLDIPIPGTYGPSADEAPLF
ncbi:DinB family protein [Aurantibacillus circumpalustris]|uniref:DinB family protein n=1 Tax=Aurantibacillus circumpalustris TaxID=3036359 RepID=UPI00295BA240|nr:DinB family protein [Aurantibacillus circumpalustris]